MAQNLQLLKQRIKTSKNISQIAKAMEMIAASKIKKAQTAVVNNKPYAQKIIEQTKRLVAAIDQQEFTHPYIQRNSSDKTLLIVLSPDKGLCGGLVTNILKKVYEHDSQDHMLIAFGKKIERASNKMSGGLVASFPFGGSIPAFSRVYPLIKLIDEYYVQGKVGKVVLIYAEFNSLFSQVPVYKQLLPLHIEINIKSESSAREVNQTYIFEPNREELLSSLLPYYLEISLYSALLESYTSEQAARMVAMQNAKNNASDIADALTLSYNKSRQEKITNELLDLNNGAVA